MLYAVGCQTVAISFVCVQLRYRLLFMHTNFSIRKLQVAGWVWNCWPGPFLWKRSMWWFILKELSLFSNFIFSFPSNPRMERLQKLLIILILLLSLIPAFYLNRWLQKLIQPRRSFGQFMLYMVSILVLVSLYYLIIVLIIYTFFPLPKR